ncbi:FecR family protein [Pusillimonas noertemannii]|uniref:FecR family protein n=1 Tax=Pusillimonas noertemannii TaxID=305977 RepID=UPI000307C743|nr:FecR domain-containing protein [Pusillimonas noertemannii]
MLTMNIPGNPNLPDDPHDAAAHWFTRERAGAMTPDERLAFAQWKAEPRNAQAYGEMLRVWQVAEATPDEVFENILQEGVKQRRNDADAPQAPFASSPGPARFRQGTPRSAGDVSHGRRGVVWGLGAACTAALAVAFVASPRWFSASEFTQRYASRLGERKTIDLPDGSTLALNTATSVVVQLGDSERRVLLEQGEAFFSVAADPSRPFVVDAGLATVKVTGTRFNVRRDTDALAVAVESGSVEVSGGRWWKPDVHRLGPGQGARVAHDAGRVRVASVDVAAASAWRQGKAVFDAAPLEAIVAELNRYRAQPIVLRNASLAQLRIAGVFSVDEPDAFLDVLPTLAPVAVRRSLDGKVEIIPR